MGLKRQENKLYIKKEESSNKKESLLEEKA